MFIELFLITIVVNSIISLKCENDYHQTICELNFDSESILNTTNSLVIKNSEGIIAKEHLSNLSISDLTITTSSIHSIVPGALCSPENLTKLAIIENGQFPDLSSDILKDCQRLKNLAVWDGRIQNGAFNDLGNLKFLIINNTKLPDVLTTEFFNNLKNLETLEIRNTHFNFDNYSLSALPNLKSLILSNNQLKKDLNLESLEKLSKIVSLDLTRNQLDSTIWPKLRNKYLKVLFLEENLIDDINVETLKKNLPNLERLFLSSRPFIPEKITQIDRELHDRNIRLIWSGNNNY